jgi:hypothetical protein
MKSAKTSRTALAKAFEVNADPSIYGTFAEIGAGQEVARFFFQAGQASQTIAKTISAYDMIYSDEIYGKETSGRYVCESRLLKMLDKEYALLHRRLDQARGQKTRFFAFANTVATGDQKKRFSHGWLGVRFQAKPLGPYNDIVLHVRLLDKYRLQQQEALGILGVNLVHTAYNSVQDTSAIINGLIENIRDGQVFIDFIRLSGPDVAHINNHLINLELVRRGLAEAILFGADQSILSASDALFQKSILVQRGTYRPVTVTHVDVLEKGVAQFKKEFPEESKNSLVLFELTMHSLSQEDGQIHEKDFLDRVRALCSLGYPVLVSNFFLFYRLKRFLRASTQKPVVMIMGASHLDRLFDEEHYKDLEGGVLEGLSKLLDETTKLYVYPHKTADSCMTTRSFFPAPKYLKIYQHFLEQKQIVDISGCDETSEYIHSAQAHTLLEKKDPTWEKYVPKTVASLIKKENLFS